MKTEKKNAKHAKAYLLITEKKNKKREIHLFNL